jgi:hypothetical protein
MVTASRVVLLYIFLLVNVGHVLSFIFVSLCYAFGVAYCTPTYFVIKCTSYPIDLLFGHLLDIAKIILSYPEILVLLMEII